DADATLYSLMATVTNYVEARSSVVLTGGIGLIGYKEDLATGDVTAKGVGYAARLGYEIRTSGRLSFTPYLAFLSTFGAVEFKAAGVRTGEFNFNNIQAGVAIGLN
ncbi:MAG TPA: hypothetical protein VEB59_10725, partial [Gemmatimonadales bacterium]|nr:hypothetical protein [Gemmatimonadales bacterium]